jgi:hypothetical protein
MRENHGVSRSETSRGGAGIDSRRACRTDLIDGMVDRSDRLDGLGEQTDKQGLPVGSISVSFASIRNAVPRLLAYQFSAWRGFQETSRSSVLQIRDPAAPSSFYIIVSVAQTTQLRRHRTVIGRLVSPDGAPILCLASVVARLGKILRRGRQGRAGWAGLARFAVPAPDRQAKLFRERDSDSGRLPERRHGR